MHCTSLQNTFRTLWTSTIRNSCCDPMQGDRHIERQLAAGRSLEYAFCHGVWGERSCLRSATTIHCAVVEWTSKRPFRGGHFTTELIAKKFLISRTLWRGVAKTHTLVDIQHPRWTVLITQPTRAMLYCKTGFPKLGYMCPYRYFCLSEEYIFV